MGVIGKPPVFWDVTSQQRGLIDDGKWFGYHLCQLTQHKFMSAQILHLLQLCSLAVLSNCRPGRKEEFSFLLTNSTFKVTFPICSW